MDAPGGGRVALLAPHSLPPPFQACGYTGFACECSALYRIDTHIELHIADARIHLTARGYVGKFVVTRLVEVRAQRAAHASECLCTLVPQSCLNDEQ
jgi:hypothetical protein